MFLYLVASRESRSIAFPHTAVLWPTRKSMRIIDVPRKLSRVAEEIARLQIRSDRSSQE
jgi:hypothetical protein